MTIAAGTRIGRYEIRSLLGAGGMGEVYLAQDSILRRSVAIKLLPADFTADKDQLHRFEREAYAASSLNHPNILTIYEIGAQDGLNYIATEFIDGESLRQHTRGASLHLREVLDIGIQVASALSAAHAAGIVHRDIKPENIMLRRDGIIKVLDFGLAKLVEHETPALETEAPTRVLMNTSPGMVMGTISYMSPEQARGIQVDARTDIWSFGCVLYEMVAGRLPFEGVTVSDVIGLILHKEPSPLARYAPDVPAELERIVTKALRRDREERYHLVKDLGLDLKSLKQRLEFEAELERTVPPGMSDEVRPLATSAERSLSETTQIATAHTGSTRDIHTTSSAEYIVSEFKRHRRGAALVTLLIAVAAVAYFFYFAKSGKAAIDSIAVLPFTNASNDPNTEYLSDGLSESLINSLSQLPNLRVMSYSSVFRYKGREADALTIGREMGVQAVLIGRVVQHGDKLSIRAELVNAHDNTHIWGKQYNRNLAAILTVQEEIAEGIAERLQPRLTGEEQRRLTKRHTESTEAYQLYLKGRYYFNRKTADDFMEGLEYFEQAIRFDPNYALAYAGMADCYYGLSFLRLSSKEAMPKAREAAQKALEIDDTLAEAHTSLALVRWTYDWDWPGAEREFKRAIEINPDYAFAHQQYGMYLALAGQFDRAITELKQAQRLDPLSLWISVDLGVSLYVARRYDEAIRQFRETLEMDKNFAQARLNLAFAYEQKGMYEEGIAEVRKAISLSGGRTEFASYLGYAYAVGGKRAEAQKMMDELKEASSQGYVPPYHVARIYTGLGEKDQAFRWLENATEERYSSMVWLKVDPLWDPLRADPRFADLVRRVGLPQ
jgi:serine/threonine protein kinase/Tfp pilus assembly protein PilF